MVGERKKRKVEKVKVAFSELVFDYYIDSFRSEMEASPSVVRGCLVSYFMVMSGLCIDTTGGDERSRRRMVGLAASLCYPTVIYSLFWLCYVVMLNVRRQREKGKRNRSTLVSVYLTLVYTYVVFPLMVWSHTTNAIVYASSSSPSVGLFGVILGVTALILGGVQTCFTLTLGRNTYPSSRWLLSSLNMKNELVVYLLNMIINIVSAYERVRSLDNDKNVTVYLILTVLQVIVLIIVLRDWTFWNRSINNLYCMGYIGFYSCKQSQLLSILFETDLIILTVLFLIIPLLWKMVILWNDHLSFINFTDNNESQARRRKGLIFCENLYVRFKKNELSKGEIEVFFRYKGLVQKYLENWTELAQEVVEVFYEDFYKFSLYFLENTDNQDEDTIETIMMHHLIYSTPNLSHMLINLKRFKTITHRGLISSFKYNHYKNLFERKLLAMYKGKLRNEVDISLSIRDSYWNIYLLEIKSQDDGYIDISLPIRTKNSFSELSKDIRGMLEEYESLILDIRSRHLLSYRRLFHSNRFILEMDRRIQNKIDVHVDSIEESCVSYYLIACMVYLRTVRFDHAKSKKLFQIYKTKRQKLIFASVSGPITPVNFLKDSCTIELSIQKGSVGEILEYSQNFEVVLGLCRDRQLKGMNINCFFPACFQDRHQQLMETFQTFPHFNLQRNFFLNDFNGFVNEVKIIVKIMPYLTMQMTSSVYIRRIKISDKILLLLNYEHDIIASQEKFKKVLETCAISPIATNLKTLFPKVDSIIQLFKLFNEFVKPKNSITDPKLRAFINQLVSIYFSLDYYNRTRGLEFEIEPISPYSVFMADIVGIMNIDFCTFKEEEITKVNLKFENDTSKNNDIGKGRSMGKEKVNSKTSEIKDSENGSRIDFANDSLDKDKEVLSSYFHEEVKRVDSGEVEIIIGNKRVTEFIRDMYDVIDHHGILDVSNNGLNLNTIKDESLLKLVHTIVRMKIKQESFSPRNLKGMKRQPVFIKVNHKEEEIKENEANSITGKCEEARYGGLDKPDKSNKNNLQLPPLSSAGTLALENIFDPQLLLEPIKKNTSKQLMRLLNDDYDLRTPKAGSVRNGEDYEDSVRGKKEKNQIGVREKRKTMITQSNSRFSKNAKEDENKMETGQNTKKSGTFSQNVNQVLEKKLSRKSSENSSINIGNLVGNLVVGLINIRRSIKRTDT